MLSLLFKNPLSWLRPRRERMRLEVLEPPTRRRTRDQVLLIPLSGLINMGQAPSLFSPPAMLTVLKDRLSAARRNKNLRAVVVRIDSPGGEVTAADLIHRELTLFKEQKKVPVIAWLGSIAASGGVYVAMAADEIYALPTTITGSIGVITMLPGLMGLGEKLGVEMRVIKSGVNKDLGSPWRPLTDDQREIFENLIRRFDTRFREVILASRHGKGLTSERLAALADGRIFDAETAQVGGLIDGIRYPHEIVARARQMAGIEDARLISYEYGKAYRGNFYALGGGLPWAWPGPAGWTEALRRLTGGAVPGLWSGEWSSQGDPRPAFLYLWWP